MFRNVYLFWSSEMIGQVLQVFMIIYGYAIFSNLKHVFHDD